jgi:DNA-binding HxlR family transcriptional regulator
MSTSDLDVRRVRRHDGSDPPPERVLDALGDEDCRLILDDLGDGAKTAGELERNCDIPQSTLYRKLDDLTETGLVGQRIRVEATGHHASEYCLTIDSVEVELADSISVSLSGGADASP